MLKYGNKEFRNLQEQVLANAQDIESIKQGAIALAQFGIFVVGSVTSADDLPDPATYLADGGTYGDAFAVGTETPYYYYVFTRPFEEGEDPHWLNVGQFPLAGPQGPQGEKGETGATPNITATADAAALSTGVPPTVTVVRSGTDAYPVLGFSFGLPRGPQGIQGPQGEQGIQGPQGVQGIQGEKGDPGYLYSLRGQVASESALPDPEQVARDTAYLVGASEPYDVYIIIGDTGSLEWLNIGPIATVKPDTFVFSNTYAESGTIDASMLAAINAEIGAYYIQVGNIIFTVVTPGTYAALEWNSDNSTGEIGVLSLDLQTGAWTIDVAYIADSDHYVTTDTTQEISGTKTFTTPINIGSTDGYTTISQDSSKRFQFKYNNRIAIKLGTSNNTYVCVNWTPDDNNTYNLGSSSYKWKDAYVSGNISNGTNSVTIADLAALITYAKSQGWIS